MRVICINEEAWPIGVEPCSEDGLIRNGEVYDVVDVEFDKGYIWYFVSIDDSGTYWENCFARCSDIDEIELIKERQHESCKI